MKRLLFAFIMLALLAQGACAEGKFNVGDSVWTKADTSLNVRKESGTSSPVIDTLIKGTVGTVVEGPVTKDGYVWWNISYDVGTIGWSAEDWLELAPSAGPQPPTDFSTWAEETISWAEERKDRRDWDGLCMRFVANAFEKVEGNEAGGNADDWAKKLYRFNQEPNGWQNAPRGAVIFFDSDNELVKGELNTHGHVGIYLGEERLTHAYGSVKESTIEEAINEAGVGRYLGWSYPSEEWKPKDAGKEMECLATALMSEASIGTNEERVAVAWTIFNRVDSPTFPNTVCEVVYQGGQYATNQEPTQEILDLATSLIGDRGTDPTGGATHFFSPISMPKEGKSTRVHDVGGGLHEVTGINEKVYFPSWTLTMEPAGDIPGVRPAYYMFYRVQAADHEVALAEEPDATESSSIDTSIILLFDASSSMADDDKIDNAKVAAKNSIATLGPKDEVALIVFYDCSQIIVEQPFTTDWSALAAMIDTIRPTGGTPLYAAKDFAQAYMDENARGGVRRIILLTDGIETCGGGPE